MTQIHFERSSGLVGRAIQYSVNLNDLSEDEAKNLQKMISDANFFGLPENLRGSATPDEFHYKVTVNDGSQSHTVRTNDTTMPRSLVPLIKELTMLKMLQ